MSYRSRTVEKDWSGFVQTQVLENGGIVVVSEKGKSDVPILCQSEADVIKNYGNPSVTYPSVFEAIAYARTAPCYVISAIGTGALYGGVVVSETAVTSLTSGAADLDTYTFSSNTQAFGIFCCSPYDSVMKVNVVTQTGSQFKATLYDVQKGNDVYVTEYKFSLIREKDNFGKSLYYDDVFDEDPYLTVVTNATTTATTFTTLSGTTKYTLDGGSRGTAPTDANKTTAYAVFNSANKYPITTIIDPFGDHATDINNLIQTYQPFAHGISVIPLGKSRAEMTSYRSSLSIDSDNVSLYANWTRIVDSYNNSSVWISNAGAIGAKYAMMADVFDGLSPAGIDENGHGGQISTWRPIETELDFSDADLQALDEAQINPFVLDEIYGLVAYGDKTLQSSNSDTSYVGTRRLYNLIIKNVTRQILRRQEFKNNDAYHRYKAQSMTENFLAPMIGLSLFREIKVVCNSDNNNDAVLEARNFILEIFCKITTNSQFTTLRLNRLSQTQTIAEFL